MIYSMTGFASSTAELDSGSLTLELRSVNHRYLDLQLRMTDELRAQEPALREAIAAQISRPHQLRHPPVRAGTSAPESGHAATAGPVEHPGARKAGGCP